MAESVRFAQSQVAEQMAANVDPEAIGRGIAEQIGLACRIFPAVAARRLSTARAMWFELPDTYSQLISGELHERVAEAIVSETRHLDAEKRCSVDAQLRTGGLSRMGVKAATSQIRKAACQADPQVICGGVVPNGHIAGSGSGRRPTPKAHSIMITTPTGHHYVSRAPDPP